MQPYIIRTPSTIPAPYTWRRWITGQWARSHVAHRATNVYLGCVWKDRKGWRYALRSGRLRGVQGKYTSPNIYKYRDEAAMQVWFDMTGPLDRLKAVTA